MDLYLFLAILTVPTGILIWISYFQVWTAGWTPTWKKDALKTIELAGSLKNKKLYDLGCGDGRFLLLGAKRGAKTTGIELDPFRYLLSKLRAIVSKNRKNIDVRYGDFFKTDIRDADVIIIYLSDKANRKLEPKLENELKKGAKVISYTYKVPGWKPIEVVKGKRSIYKYIIPESMENSGEWI